jgi:hypothetical protein
VETLTGSERTRTSRYTYNAADPPVTRIEPSVNGVQRAINATVKCSISCAREHAGLVTSE